MYVVKAFFSNGASVASADTIGDAFATWQRIVSSHGEEPFLERCEVWSKETGLVAVYDVEGVTLLTPAMETTMHVAIAQRRQMIRNQVRSLAK